MFYAAFMTRCIYRKYKLPRRKTVHINLMVKG